MRVERPVDEAGQQGFRRPEASPGLERVYHARLAVAAATAEVVVAQKARESLSAEMA